VDPGVGTDRRPIGLRTARGDVLLGPDNGLLLPAAERLGGVVDQRLLSNRDWMLPATSATFHGRDIFAPIGAHLALGKAFDDVGPALDPDGLVALDLPRPTFEAGRLSTRVAYVDSFGNLRLAGTVADLEMTLGRVAPSTELELDLMGARERASWQQTFGDVAAGELLAYEDSSGDLAIAVSSGSAARRLDVTAGSRIYIRRA
jgi:S-adenosylmethionine hydrolase